MPASRFVTAALALFFATSATLALAQAQPAPASPAASTYEPSVGQDGKDVVWVPTPQVVVDKMLDMAKVTPKDFVMDLGSGDGRTVITAAKRGARALGIEYNPEMVELSRRAAEQAGVSARATFQQADLFETDLSKASVITMFLLPAINLQLRPNILKLKPGTRVVSNTFTMGDWKPDAKSDLTSTCGASYCTALLWIVPATVAGTHKLPQGNLTLKQEYQMLTGTLATEGKLLPVTGKVHGTDITLTAGSHEYHGKMVNKQLELR
jgi:SAM-dependent methyltransferase